MESDIRYYRRRANEELAAAGRAVTSAARERRMQLADLFLERLSELQSGDSLAAVEDFSKVPEGAARRGAFDWSSQQAEHRA